MLNLVGVTVGYGGPPVVTGVDLQVPDGQVLALLGPSGCGKTTLLRAIAGLEPVGSGAMYWDGTDLGPVPVHRRGFGLMFQEGVLFPHRDVAGNIAYGLHRAGLPSNAIAARVQELLELVGLPGSGGRKVGTLSGGEAQRVALARALAPKPRLLLLDEPLAALDRELRERLLADLRAVLTATGTTAVFVTHDQAEAFAVADLVAVMKAGVIRQFGSTRQIWTHPADAWVAGFLGYSSLVDPAAAAVLSAPVPGPGQLLALRPGALVLDPAGPIDGQVEVVVPAPDGDLVQLRIQGVGAVRAVRRPGIGEHSGSGPAVGDRVTVRFDPAATALVPPDPPVPVGRAAGTTQPGQPAQPRQIVVAGCLVEGGRVLAARRSGPPEVAGRWELPGGKVEPAETEQAALARELAEELGIAVSVGDRVGVEVTLPGGMILRAYRAAITSGRPVRTEHGELRWLAASELDALDWVPADRLLLGDLRRLLAG